MGTQIGLLMTRPYPPADLNPFRNDFRRAPDVEQWITDVFLTEKSPLYNEEHDHLAGAFVGVLWATEPVKSQGNAIAGTCEIPQPKGMAWVRVRQEYQLLEWFGGQCPDILITLYAPYAAECDDVNWCSLVEHELYHTDQKINPKTGAPMFHKDGRPQLRLRGHDVEEFVGIVRRYGAGAGAGQTAALVRAAQQEPAVARSVVNWACGTCKLLAA